MTDLQRIERLLMRLVVAVEALATPEEPNYRYALADFARFDWDEIGATITQKDNYGVSAVQWGGHMWTRRSGDGKYGKAIWFSRPSGQDEDGTNYLRLVTFKDLSPAEPVPGGVVREVKTNGRRPSPQPQRVRPEERGLADGTSARSNPFDNEPPAQKVDPSASSGQALEKDWELEAATSEEPLMFDTAVLKAWPWYRDVTAVTTFRDTLFGAWKAGEAPALVAGMRTYVEIARPARRTKTPKGRR